MWHTMSKEEVIRFRCDTDMRLRFQRVAAMLRRDEPDLARLWFEDMILAEEQRLGLILNPSTLRDGPNSRTTALPLDTARRQAVDAASKTYRKKPSKKAIPTP
jgi:hypothetical protein